MCGIARDEHPADQILAREVRDGTPTRDAVDLHRIIGDADALAQQFNQFVLADVGCGITGFRVQVSPTVCTAKKPDCPLVEPEEARLASG